MKKRVTVDRLRVTGEEERVTVNRLRVTGGRRVGIVGLIECG